MSEKEKPTPPSKPESSGRQSGSKVGGEIFGKEEFCNDRVLGNERPGTPPQVFDTAAPPPPPTTPPPPPPPPKIPEL